MGAIDAYSRLYRRTGRPDRLAAAALVALACSLCVSAASFVTGWGGEGETELRHEGGGRKLLKDFSATEKVQQAVTLCKIGCLE